MDRAGGRPAENDCWRGKGDSAVFRPGLPEVVKPADTIEALFERMGCCTRCDLAPDRTQVVLGTGPVSARLMLVGEAPGAQEDRKGRPFVGRAGQLLDGLLERSGLERDDVFITNVVACRPPANRTPRVREVKAHAPWLEEQLRLVAPDVVVTLGRVALTYFLPGAKVTEVRGSAREIEREGRVIHLLPVLHPAAALRRRELLPALQEDFAKVPALLAHRAGGR